MSKRLDEGESNALVRVPSGIAGLDVILEGGFFRGGSYIFMGAPGSGKTITASQICFGHAAAGGKALFVTLLTESHGRLLANLRTLSFFDESVLGSTLSFVSAYNVLEQHGLRGLTSFLRKLVRSHKATLLVIDGMLTAAGFAETEVSLKKFVHELHVAQDIVGCTTILLTNNLPRNDRYPEQTMVDGLIELSERPEGFRAIRELEVRKFRGSSTVRGRHVFEISDEGVSIYPRVEAVQARAAARDGSNGEKPESSSARLAFGIEGLDAMLAGGVRQGSTTMLFGTPGAGKTLLGLHFLAEGLRRKEGALYLGFDEDAGEIVAKGKTFSLDLAKHVKRGLLRIQWEPAPEFLLDAMATQLVGTAREGNVRRVFIDGVPGLRLAVGHLDRMFGFFGALTRTLRAEGITTVVSDQPAVLFGPEIESPSRVPFDNLILVRQVELHSRLHRLISILKMRDSGFDSSIREFQLTGEGIAVADSLESAEAILTGLPLPTGGETAPSKKASVRPRRRRGRPE